MSDVNDLTEDDRPDSERRHPFGIAALILWGIALLCPFLAAGFAFNRIRLLILAGGLLMIDIAFAVLCSLLWWLNRHLVKVAAEGGLLRLVGGYAYRAGWHDCDTAQSRRPELRLLDGGANGHRATDAVTTMAWLAVNRTH